MNRFKIISPYLLLFVLASFTTVLAQDQRFIAILPFTNTGSAESNWVARGIEEILYDKFTNLHSATVFEKETLDRILLKNGIRKASDLTVRNAFLVGKETGVDVLLTGDYLVMGQNLKIHFRVVSTYTGADIFSDSFEGRLSDIYRIHAEAIQEILQVMAIPVNDADRQMLAKSSTKSIQGFEYYCKAYTEFQRGSGMELVASLFMRALQQDPDFWEAQYNLGVIYYNFDQYQKALAQFQSVIQKNPSFYKPYYGIGVIYYLQRNYSKAIGNFDKVLELNPDHDRTLYYLGRVYVRLDSVKKGLEYLEKSAQLNPNYAPTQYHMGLANMKRGWYKTAVQAFRTSIKLDPDNYLAHNALGESYYSLQRFDDAVYEYQKAIELRKDFSTAYFNIGNTVYKKGALEEIVDAYLEILETRYTRNSDNNGNSEILGDLKQLKNQNKLQSADVYNKMIHSYRDALEYEPSFFEAAFNLALTYEKIGRADSAEFFYKKTISTNPDLVRAHMRLGRLYESQQRFTEALQQFKDVVKIEPSYFAATPRLGEDYRYINIIEEVLQEYQKKRELRPNDPETLIVLARIFNSLGRLGQAEQYYKQIVQLDPQNREATKELNNIRRQLKKM